MEFNACYVELDALLDTRLSLINEHLMEDEILTILKSGYFNRMEDHFPGLERDKFKSLYNSRDKSILINAFKTNIVNFVKEFVREASINEINYSGSLKPKVFINTYPYELASEEDVNILSAMRDSIALMCDIQLINISREELTPKYVKKNFSLLIMYDYVEWLEYHAKTEEFKTVTMPDIGLIGPRFFFKEPPSQPELEELKSKQIDPFKDMEDLVAPLISLKLIPIDNFSIVIKK